LKWVQEFQEETQRARLEAAEARREVAEVRRELAECRHEAEALATDLRNLRGAIMAPSATLERLRAMVGGGGLNGR
jgi:transposase-like protein